MKKKQNAIMGIIISIVMVIIGIIVMDDRSFPLIGIALIILSISIRSYILSQNLSNGKQE